MRQLEKERLSRQLALESKGLRDAQASAALVRGQAAWMDKIRGKIRGNLIKPDNLVGNPQAVFDVTLLPGGEVLSVKLRESSGNPALDAATERAIRKSDPLPKPDDPSAFERELRLTFKPNDE